MQFKLDMPPGIVPILEKLGRANNLTKQQAVRPLVILLSKTDPRDYHAILAELEKWARKAEAAKSSQAAA